MLLLYIMSYVTDIKKLSDYEKSLKPIATEMIDKYTTNKIEMFGCTICKQYSNSDLQGTLIHSIRSHKEILFLIKESR